MIKKNDKTIEQTDYYLKANKKFPPDKKFPETEQSKPNNKTKPKKSEQSVRKSNKIEQNPGSTSKGKQKRIY